MGSKSDETKNRIMEAAERLIVKMNINAISMQDLCDEANISRGGLYRYYKSPQEVFGEIFKSKTANIKAMLQNLLDKGLTPKEVMENLFAYFSKYLCDGNQFFSSRILTLYYKDKDETSKQMFKEYTSIFSNLLRLGQIKGEFRQDIDADVISNMMTILFGGVQIFATKIDIDENYINNFFDIARRVIYAD